MALKRILLPCLLLALLLSGCRVRVVQSPAQADALRYTEAAPTAPPETEAPETTAPPETSRPPEPTAPPAPAEAPETAPSEAAPTPTAAVTPISAPSPTAPAAGIPAPVEETEAPAEPAATVTLTLDPNGGESDYLQTELTVGEPYGPLPAAVWRGHVFGGWWTAPEGGERILPETPVTAAEAHTLYAHWQTAPSLTVFFDGNGGRVKSRESSLQLCPGDLYGTLPTPLREGYDWLGWFTLPDGGERITAESVFTAEADQTLYAQWSYNPAAFWSFTLQNKTQQIYQCQQAAVYFETQQDGVTQPRCGLISDTGSFNVAANVSDPNVSDDWVLAKNPQAIVKCVDSLVEAEAVRAAVSARFPGKQVFLVTADALGGGSYGLYARLALAKALYPDWYYDVSLDTVAAELALAYRPFR